jgi:hypothetical protein
MVSGCQKEGGTNLNKGEDSFMDEFNITKTVKEISDTIFKDGCVKDEITASEIAISILKTVYGDDFDNGLPLLIQFDTKKQCWLIKTQLPDGMDGGSKYIIIKKSNAEILGIWATK